MQIKDCKFDDLGLVASFRSTKSKDVTIRLTMSTAALQNLIKHHKDRGNRNAYIFYAQNSKISASRFRAILRECAERANLGRRVWPHLLRHSRIAILKDANFLSTEDLKNIGGWERRTMLDRYGEISMPRTNEKLAQMAGLAKEKKKDEVKVRKCPRCGFVNDFLGTLTLC